MRSTRSSSTERCMFLPGTTRSWRWTPQPARKSGRTRRILGTTLITNRGIDYWESVDGYGCSNPPFSIRNELQELDARTGRSIPTVRHQWHS